MTRIATHAEPVWRERSNFLIRVAIHPEETDIATEQLWARKIDDTHFELCCIPFFAYDLALGDVVETDHQCMVRGVSTQSGRFVFRAYFGNTPYPRDLVAEELIARGALLEWSSTNLLAIDARDLVHAQEIAAFLQKYQDLGRLIYEAGKS